MLLLLACTRTLDCSVAESAQSSLVAEVHVASPGGTTYVRYDADGHTGEAPPQEGAGDLIFELLDLPPHALVEWEAENDGATCEGTFEAGNTPDLPWVEVTIDAAGQYNAPWVIGSFYKMGADEAWMAAYRRDGTLAWYLQGEDDHNALDFEWVDGVLFHNEFASDMVSDDSFVVRTTPGGAPIERIDTPLGHHMFEVKDDGTIAYQALDSRSVDGETWVGDAIIELAPDGTSTTVFSAWDAIEPTWNDYMDGPDFYTGLDWTHGNALKWDGQRYLLSLGHAGDLIVVEDGVATTIWGPDGLPADPPFSYQHDAHWLPDGNILLFSTDTVSAAIEYAVSDEGLSEVWRHQLDGAALYLGQGRRLPNGNTFVCGGQLGVMQEVTPDGEVVWEMRAEAPWGFAQWTLVSDLYTGAP